MHATLTNDLRAVDSQMAHSCDLRLVGVHIERLCSSATRACRKELRDYPSVEQPIKPKVQDLRQRKRSWYNALVEWKDPQKLKKCTLEDLLSKTDDHCIYAYATPSQDVAMNIKERPNHSLYIRVLRRMSSEARLMKAFELTEFSKQLFLHGLRSPFPDLAEGELHKMYLERLAKCHNRNY